MSKSASSAIVGFLVFAAGLGGFMAGHELGKEEQKEKACQCGDSGCRCTEPVCYSDYPTPPAPISTCVHGINLGRQCWRCEIEIPPPAPHAPECECCECNRFSIGDDGWQPINRKRPPDYIGEIESHEKAGGWISVLEEANSTARRRRFTIELGFGTPEA